MQPHSSPSTPLSANARVPDDEVLTPLLKVAQRHDVDPLAERLAELRAWLADDLVDLESAITRIDVSFGPHPFGNAAFGVGKAAHHLLNLTGKRIRPLCVILSARLGGRAMDTAVRDLAVACEIVHAATLLHDDVIDDATERRGAPAARLLYGNASSILAGDHLLVTALQRVQQAQPQSLPSILEVISRMVAAEALQLERRGRFEPSRDIYLRVIQGKTAALFQWGLQAGGIAASLDDRALAALSRLGLCLGMAFQLVDDVLDVAGETQLTGKDALADLREGKLTWPMIIAAERDPAFCALLENIVKSTVVDAQDIERVVAGIHHTGALAETRTFAVAKADEACRELAHLPQGAARDALQCVIESAVHRAR